MKISEGYNLNIPDLKLLSNKLQHRNQIDINQEIGNFKIEKDRIDIEIDNQPRNYDLGYRKLNEQISDFRNDSREHILQVIGHYARTGDRLMDFHYNKITEIATEESSEEIPEVKLNYIRSPEIQVRPGKLEIDFDSKIF